MLEKRIWIDRKIPSISFLLPCERSYISVTLVRFADNRLLMICLMKKNWPLWSMDYRKPMMKRKNPIKSWFKPKRNYRLKSKRKPQPTNETSRPSTKTTLPTWPRRKPKRPVWLAEWSNCTLRPFPHSTCWNPRPTHSKSSWLRRLRQVR